MDPKSLDVFVLIHIIRFVFENGIFFTDKKGLKWTMALSNISWQCISINASQEE